MAKRARKAPAAKRARARKSAKRKNPGGRPSKFRPEMLEQVRILCERGFTDQEIADLFGVTDRTLYRWKLEHPEFVQAMKIGKDVPDDRVERSLYALAIGYEHDDVDIRTAGVRIVKTKIRKHYPPHAVAAIFWLKNRRREQWRDRVDSQDGSDSPTPEKITVEVVDASRPEGEGE